MLVGFLIFIVLILVTGLGVAVFYAIRWAGYIFTLEDDLEEAVEIHQRTEATLENILKMPMFFDSPEIKATVNEALENVKICQTATQKLIFNFTQRSKQRYVRLIDNEDDVE